MPIRINTERQLLTKVLKHASNNAKAISNQTLTLSGASQSLTVPANTNYAFLAIEGGAGTIAYFWQDGTAPTIGTGIPLTAGTTFDISDYANISNFRIIGAGTLQVQYFNIQM